MSHPQQQHSDGERLAEETVQIMNRYGLHGRPTTLFVKLANRFVSEVKVSRLNDSKSEEVDGKSAIALLSLGLEHGGMLRIRALGEDASDAVTALAELVRTKFSEA